jgi:hypothetical protein
MLSAVLAGSLVGLGPGRWLRAQEAEDGIERPAPPALEDFEADKNGDGVPDGWYNLRDAKLVDEGGVIGPRYLRFECSKPGRPARLSRAFGVDGRKHEAIVIGLWVRLDQIQSGERTGDDPGLMIDFLGSQLRQSTRGTMGPWTVKGFGAGHWTRVAKRIPIPSSARDAIMSLGLLGATGVLDVDGLTFDLVPVGGTETTNLVRNPDFELGDPDPDGWVVGNGARRGFPGFRSPAALELAKDGARGMTSLALPIETFPQLALTLKVRGQGLRGGGGATAYVFFLNEDGDPLPGQLGQVRPFVWSGTFDWREETAIVPVPQGAVRAVLQFDKPGGIGSLKLDDVAVTASPTPDSGRWTPYHVADDTGGWKPFAASTGVEANSALDFSFLAEGPAGKSGAVTVKEGRLHFAKGSRARFFGVQLLAPMAFVEPARADALADRLARSGVNLVRLGDLDSPLGPDRSLFDDTRDDTLQFDPVALQRLDHLIAALKKRGIYFALELQGARRFRSEDGVAMSGALPPGGGQAAVFDPTLVKLVDDAARALLAHVNPETGLALRADPALAWVTLSGEVTMFNRLDDPSLPGDYQKTYQDVANKSPTGSGRRLWQKLDEDRWKGLADLLRKDGLKAPVAGVSHWRRVHEFSEAQAKSGLDLIDDRIYWNPPPTIAPRWRSMLWSLDGGLIAEAAQKRKTDRPYVVGQWCDYTQGVWASPYEAAEQLLAATTARSEDWDGLVRRGVFVYPEAWGSAAPGTAGGEDIFQVPEVANAAPQVFALWPHAASIYLRGGIEPKDKEKEKPAPRAPAIRRGANRARRPHVPGWEPERGRLVVETPYTQGVAGWPGDDLVASADLVFDPENTYGVVVASSTSVEPISRARRLLVTAIARVMPTGFLWVDDWRRETASPGRPPLLHEPMIARVTWRRKGSIKAYALDNNGARVGPARVQTGTDGTTLVIDGTSPSVHFELVAE